MSAWCSCDRRLTSAVQRYISTRSMFIDPKELALGQSEPVVDTQTALAAKRRLGTLYKSITQAVRHEAAIMQAVFTRPREALTLFVHRLFEQRIQVTLRHRSRIQKLALLPHLRAGAL